MWTAVTSYCSIIAPREMSVTIQGLHGGLQVAFGNHLYGCILVMILHGEVLY